MLSELTTHIEESISKLDQEIHNDGVIIAMAKEIKMLKDIKYDALGCDDIAKLILTLGIQLTYLSKRIERYKFEYNNAYTFRKIRGAKLYNEVEAITVRDRESLVEYELRDIRNFEVYAAYKNDVLNNIHNDISRLISILQSVLRVKEREIIQSPI